MHGAHLPARPSAADPATHLHQVLSAPKYKELVACVLRSIEETPPDEEDRVEGGDTSRPISKGRLTRKSYVRPLPGGAPPPTAESVGATIENMRTVLLGVEMARGGGEGRERYAEALAALCRTAYAGNLVLQKMEDEAKAAAAAAAEAETEAEAAAREAAALREEATRLKAEAEAEAETPNYGGCEMASERV